MYNDYFAPASYYEKPDYDVSDDYFGDILTENQLRDAREYFESLVSQLFGKGKIDEEELTRDIEELCCTLCVPFPKQDLTITRI